MPDPGPPDGPHPVIAAAAAVDRVAPTARAIPAPGDVVSDWQRYVRAAARRKGLVAGITLAGLILGLAATRVLDPRFVARATLWIESAARPADPGLASSEQLLEAAGWGELATSRAVLDAVVRELRLYLTPRSAADRAALRGFAVRAQGSPGAYRLVVSRDGAYRLVNDRREVVERGTLGDSVGRTLGFAWAPERDDLAPGGGERTIEFSVTTPDDAAQALARALRVRLDPAGNFLRIQLRGTDAALTTATVNAVAQRVVAVAAELKRQKFEELVKILGEQLGHARGGLDAAEAELRDFRVRTAGTPTAATDDARDPGGVIALGLSLDELRRDRAALEGVLAAGGGQSSAEALGEITAVKRSPDLTVALQEAVAQRATLRALRFRYTDSSAAVRAAAAAIDSLEQNAIPALVRRLLQELDVEERDLATRVASETRGLQAVPARALRAARLERDVENAEALFSDVHRRYEAARLALVSTLPDVRVLDDAAKPRRPVSDLGPLLVLLATVAGFGVAIATVTIADRVDPRMRDPAQVAQDTGLRILGAVPHVRQDGNGGADQAIEALRGLRLRLLHTHNASPLTLTVSSPGPGEGKSFVSANLSLSFAQAGYRVVLVDGDIRRGTQHRVFERSAAPGLTDVLAGRVALDAALQPTAYPGVSLLAAGRPLHRAPELLLSRRMRDVVERLRGRCDVVIVDSPPLAAGVDPLVLATVTGPLLLVFRAGTTDLQLAASRLETIEALPLRLLGVVLNDVRPGGAYRSYTYGLPGYDLPPDDVASEWNEPPLIVGGVR